MTTTPVKTVTLPDGYNGHTVQCHADPIKIDGNVATLRVVDSYMIRACDLSTLAATKEKETQSQ